MNWENKSIFMLTLILIFVLTIGVGCTSKETKSDDGSLANTNIILATTTSTENSGLLAYLLPVFKEDTGIDVKVVAVGTGQALRMGEDGEADVILAHAKSAEEKLVREGHTLERFDVMYNDFVLIGSKGDKLDLMENAKKDIIKALTLIYKNKATFVSRGDDSGTHKKELALWKEAGLEPSGDWYISVGQGMGNVILMTDEKQGYTISDRATYLSMKAKVDLAVVSEGDNRLFNQYGIMAVNPEKNDRINSEGAQKFIEWILSEKGQKLIGEFGKDEFGQSLFIPNAK